MKKIHVTFSKFINENIDSKKIIDLYKNRINSEYNNLLKKVEEVPNYIFLLGSEMKYLENGKANKCETNTYEFIKKQIISGIDYYYSVGGFLFTPESLTPIEHWWVYDSKNDIHLEITPIIGEKPWCYAGIINYNINDKIVQSGNVFDVDFFLSGNVYSWYFKK